MNGYHPTSTSARAVFVCASLLYLATRFWQLTASCLWFDEIFSVHAARHSWMSLLGFVVEDIVHPPLFYALLKIWIGIGGDHVLWLRLLPALFAALALGPFLLLCRELKIGLTAVNVAVLLLAISSYFLKYAQTLRMYSLLLLLGLASAWLCMRLMKDQARRVSWALVIVNLLLVYTHYFGWALVAAELIVCAVLAREKFAALVWQTLGLAVGFGPWAWAVAGAVVRQRGLQQNIGWAPQPRLGEAVNFYFALHEIHHFRWNIIVALVLFVVPLALLIWRVFRHRRDVAMTATRRTMFVLATFAFTPTAGAFVLSHALPQSIWGGRHLIGAAVFYVLLVAVGLDAVRPALWRTALLVAVGCWLFAAGAAVLVRRPEQNIWCAWEPLTERVRRESAAESVTQIFVFEDLIAYHVWFALDTVQERRLHVVRVRGIASIAEDPAYFLPRLFDDVEVKEGSSAIAGERFWLAFRNSSQNEEDLLLKIVRERGYEIDERFEINTPDGTALMVGARRPSR